MEYLFSMQKWFSGFSGVEILLKGVIFYLAFFWFALIIWVARDAINRSNNILFHVFAILLNIFLPVFGLMIYLLVRSPRTLIDKYYEDLELQALSGDKQGLNCPECSSIIEKDYKFCGECGIALLKKCDHCKRDHGVKLKICPYCGKGKSGKSKQESD